MSVETAERTGILLQVSEKGESFTSLAFLLKESGLEYFLHRNSKRKARPDLFDTASIRSGPQKTGPPQFIQEYSVIKRRERIGKSFERVKTASRFANLLRRNTQHLADPSMVFPICEQFFDSVAQGVSLPAAYLKALYLFASIEGFPLKEDWALRLKPELRSDLRSVLTTTLHEQTVNPLQVEALSSLLEAWLTREAHFSIENYSF